MRNIFKNLAILSALLFTFSCDKNPDLIIYDVLEVENGAILRTIQVLSSSLNSSEPTSKWSVIVEEQDAEDGALLKAVHIYVTLRDLTSDNGTTTTNQAFIKTVDASEFTTGPVGLPRATLSVTFAEATGAMGLSSGDYAPGDLYVFETKLELTDGRIYGADDAGGIITGGFFSSPYKYNALVSCSPEPGTYRLDMQDAYGDGWQSDGIGVTIDGVTTNYRVGDTDDNVESVDIVVPVGTQSLIWEWYGDSWVDEVTFQIYAPDGSPLGAFVGNDPISDYGCGCSILSVPGVDTQVAEAGLLPILLCAQ